jgi:energy-converting hydrogenase Eha subunit B
MLMEIGGVVGGLIAWFLIANVGNGVLHAIWPGYSGAEVAKTFTVGMAIARLVVGAVSSLCAGFVAAWITNRSTFTIKLLAGVLVVLFLPIITLWEHFPPRYHVSFLVSLPVATVLGGLLYPRRRKQPM